MLAPQRTSTWSSLRGSCPRTAGPGHRRGHQLRQGLDWGRVAPDSRGWPCSRGPQGRARLHSALTPLSASVSAPLCLQILPSALSLGVRDGRGVEEGKALGDW